MNPHPFCKHLALLLAVFLPARSSLSASPSNQEQIVRFELSPAPLPDPALKYTLITPIAEQIPGAAAPFYLAAETMMPTVVSRPDGKTLDDLIDDTLDMPLTDLKHSDVRNYFGDGAPHFLELGSLRTRAEWPNSMRQEGFNTLLPYLNSLRSTAQYTVVRARVRLADGDTLDAIKFYRILLTLSHHLQDEGVLVQDLVACGIAELTLDHLHEILQRPDAPNLYWALGSLPRPMLDLHQAFEWEKLMMRASTPALRDGRTPEDLAPAEWSQVDADYSHLLGNAGPSPTPFAAAALAIPFYPKAKQILISHGTSLDVVNAMPVPQAIGLAILYTYDHWNDEYTKWSAFPYWQAAPAIQEIEKSLALAKAADPLNPAFTLIPSLARSYATAARLDRHIAALQTLEALRAYAFSHNNKLPSSLDQLSSQTPAPLDPITGKPFLYVSTNATTADLTSPPPPNQPKIAALHYVITLRK